MTHTHIHTHTNSHTSTHTHTHIEEEEGQVRWKKRKFDGRKYSEERREGGGRDQKEGERNMRGKEKSDLLSEAEVTEFDVVEIIAVCGGTNK